MSQAPERRPLQDRLVGTWTTELDNDGTPVTGLSQFSADGGVILTQLNAKNIGLGNWVATGRRSLWSACGCVEQDPGHGVGAFRGRRRGGPAWAPGCC